MPPRKSRRTKNKSGDDSINPKDVKQLRFSQQVVYEDGSLGVLKTFDLKSIKAHLIEQQSEVEIQRDLIDITALQEQRDAADRRYKDSLASEKRAGKAPGRSAASREYKASLDCLNARLRNANRRTTRTRRLVLEYAIDGLRHNGISKTSCITKKLSEDGKDGA
jgi:hypothetical protein